MPPRRRPEAAAEGAFLAAESDVTRGEESRLKAGCSQDWLPHNKQTPCQTRGVSGILLVGLGGHDVVGKNAELLPGTLDMLILKAVSLRPLHGYGVLLRIRQISGDALEIPQGSLYPALYRLEHQDLIAAEWGQSENNRRAKYYTVTAAGRRRLREETAGWNRLASAIAAALNTTSEEV
jgi:PadR family transcriptional regulator PadR